MHKYTFKLTIWNTYDVKMYDEVSVTTPATSYDESIDIIERQIINPYKESLKEDYSHYDLELLSIVLFV